MAFIEVRNVARAFPGVLALNQINLDIELGKIHIFAGENGAGKSTLVKILTGTYEPSSGSLTINGKNPLENRALFNKVAYVPQELSLFSHMSVLENLFMPFKKTGTHSWSLSYKKLEEKAQKILDRFSINAKPHHLVKNIPVADQQLLQIARAANSQAFQLIILDEPTSSLTQKETERLFRIIREFRDLSYAVIFISHKMDEIFSLGDTVSVLRNGQLIATHDMSKINASTLIEQMCGEAIGIHELFLPKLPPQNQKPLLHVKNLSGQSFSDISFVLHSHEILGFAGLVGAGRSELMQSIFGYLEAKSGEVLFENNSWRIGVPSKSTRLGLHYLPEERRSHGIFPTLSVRENASISMIQRLVLTITSRLSSFGVISSSKEKNLVQKVIQAYAVKTSSFEKKMMFLSGGNQQKIIIGRAMAATPKVLIFDEPTKGIDVKAKAEIYRLMQKLADEGVGIILISSDMEELRKCSSRILTMYHGRLNSEFSELSSHISPGAFAILQTKIMSSILGQTKEAV